MTHAASAPCCWVGRRLRPLAVGRSGCPACRVVMVVVGVEVVVGANGGGGASSGQKEGVWP